MENQQDYVFCKNSTTFSSRLIVKFSRTLLYVSLAVASVPEEFLSWILVEFKYSTTTSAAQNYSTWLQAVVDIHCCVSTCLEEYLKATTSRHQAYIHQVPTTHTKATNLSLASLSVPFYSAYFSSFVFPIGTQFNLNPIKLVPRPIPCLGVGISQRTVIKSLGTSGQRSSRRIGPLFSSPA